MSVQTWMAVYYPKPAHYTREDEALDHSLRKWEGLRPGALSEHGITVAELRGYVDSSGNVFTLDADSCSLCVHFYMSPHHETACGACPLAQARDGSACDAKAPDESISPYSEFTKFRDPEPMLVQLRRAKERETIPRRDNPGSDTAPAATGGGERP